MVEGARKVGDYFPKREATRDIATTRQWDVPLSPVTLQRYCQTALTMRKCPAQRSHNKYSSGRKMSLLQFAAEQSVAKNLPQQH